MVDQILSADHCHDSHSGAVLRFFTLHYPSCPVPPAPGPAQPSAPQPSRGAELLCSVLPADGDWKPRFAGTATPRAAARFQKAITHPLQARRCLLLRPAFLGEGSAVFKEQQSFPLSELPRSSAEKQKGPETPAIDRIYQCRSLWEIGSNRCNCIQIYTHTHI